MYSLYTEYIRKIFCISQLTEPYKHFLSLLLLAQLVLIVDGHVVLPLGELHNLSGTEVNAVVEVAEEEEVVKLVCQVELV